ncbi:MAG TPA: hypothetical protein PL124_08820 [Candidatus Cloacimonadota bacterium]|nr:hypothetical protein [Candidatus Cloacimonadota bacterium]
MIKDLYDALIACKYDVSLLPQEKRPDRKMVFRLADIDIEVSDSNLYTMPVYVELEWNDTKPLEIPTYIKTLCQEVEEYLYDHSVLKRGSFQWQGPKIEPKGGSQYNIILRAMYLEEIQV